MINEITKMDAIQSLRPNAQCVTRGDVIEWMDDIQTQPTDTEIATEVTRLQAEYDSKQYARDRAEAYPSLTEQADMAYWDRQNNTTTLDDSISDIKARFPK
jgi:hypothetical protein